MTSAPGTSAPRTPANRPTPDSVRLAWPAEAAAIAELQRRSWDALPAELGTALLRGITLAEMTEAWHLVLTRPQQATRRLLVAVEHGQIAGFATTGEAQDPDRDPVRDGEIDQFVIDPPARHLGHGSRLLNACADTLRADGFDRAVWWVLASDDVLRAFLGVGGWAPDGAHREIGSDEVSVRVKQIRLHTDLTPA